ELYQVMDYQAQTQDLTARVPVDPFTEAGHIAHRYNQVMDAFEARHHKSVEDLAEIYYVTAAISAAIEHETFDAQRLGLDEVMERGDEIGALARTIRGMAQLIQSQKLELGQLKQGLKDAHQPPAPQ
ncbi:MAG: HAMP domain-containing protein, partial [Cyanobacteria bacterium P01_F01_bin.153]